MLILVCAFVLFSSMQPPIIPAVKFEGDTSNFDDYPEADEQGDYIKPFEAKKLVMFEDF